MNRSRVGGKVAGMAKTLLQTVRIRNPPTITRVALDAYVFLPRIDELRSRRRLGAVRFVRSVLTDIGDLCAGRPEHPTTATGFTCQPPLIDITAQNLIYESLEYTRRMGSESWPFRLYPASARLRWLLAAAALDGTERRFFPLQVSLLPSYDTIPINLTS